MRSTVPIQPNKRIALSLRFYSATTAAMAFRALWERSWRKSVVNQSQQNHAGGHQRAWLRDSEAAQKQRHERI